MLESSKVLSPEEVSRLQVVLTRNEKSCFRDVTFLWMLLHTGARVSEVLNLRTSDLIEEDSSVFVNGLKSSMDREIPLTPYLFNRMTVLASQVGVGERIFPFGYERARQLWCEWRPVNKRIHSIRHFRAHDIYRRTKDIRLVQRVLGHCDIQSTMIYLEYDYSKTEMRRALL